MNQFAYVEMDMPTPCIHCDAIFDLNDGYPSNKWHKNTVICPNCHEEEAAEVEEDERLEDLNIELSNALYNVKWEELTQENKNTLRKLIPVDQEMLKNVFPVKAKHKTFGELNLLGMRTECPSNNNTMFLVKPDGQYYWVYDYETEILPQK
ncbi:hypothetical protein [uncultured Draconibacterium sp.]|uniref:hypothetical protein n=1 Tax=uncultured Draconibacterium sp. TaxID=1573823 RepID=UPI0025DD3EDF|nr:hypothetical protein [uncultured Draconibacterium sp.]